MGIMHTGADFLIRSKVEGVRFDKTLTLGRQAMFVSPVQLVKMLKAGGIWRPETNVDEFYASFFGSPYRTEGLFRFLGATTLDDIRTLEQVSNSPEALKHVR
jgi:hypothetical protein